MTKPNVDWELVQEAPSHAIIHKTTAQQDNMRAVRMQLGGKAIDCDRPAPFWPAYDGNPSMGVGESIFSPEEIAQFQEAALAVYTESMKQVQSSHEWALEHLGYAVIGDIETAKLYLVEDTEFSDSDVEDYYLGKAPT